MIYVEMSRTESHGGKGWGFSECLWSPTRKKPNKNGKPGGRWSYWEKVHGVRVGDTILHLKGVSPKAEFVGWSRAASDGYIAASRPPEPDDWGYASDYYRVDLVDFEKFENPINLTALFAHRGAELTDYFFKWKKVKRKKGKPNLFYVYQKRRLQCQNGAYLSDLDADLFDILFDSNFLPSLGGAPSQTLSVKTSEQIRNIKARVGQEEFSDRVKTHYGNRCCFPSCDIRDARFLIGSHIARWSDNAGMRGNIQNGLCFCVLHDKAFEVGLFTLDHEFRVRVNPREINIEPSIAQSLRSADGQQISLGSAPPLVTALEEHWTRIEFYPEGG